MTLAQKKDYKIVEYLINSLETPDIDDLNFLITFIT